MDIKKLLEGIEKGDPEAWNMIVDRYSKTIYNMALNFAGNSDDAADITQDIFIKLFSNVQKFKPDGNFNSWIMRLSKNHCIDFWRKNRKNRQVLSLNEDIRVHDHDEESRQVDRMDIRRMRTEISKLDPELRILLIMRDIQNYSYQEIARDLELPLGTVKSRINRGRIKLARNFEQKGESNGM